MSRAPASAALALTAALGLAACSDAGAGAKGICTPFPAASAAAAPVGGPAAVAAADPSAPLDDCLHRWAYALARSRDPADTVAQASVAACAGVLSRWNQQSLAPLQGPGGDSSGATLSLTTGQPTNAFVEHREFADSRALFYVVQARAGRCPAPPMGKGAPTALPG